MEKILSAKLREYRLRKKISQQKLADLSFVHVRTILELESGKRNPTLKTFLKIIHILEIPLSEIIQILEE